MAMFLGTGNLSFQIFRHKNPLKTQPGHFCTFVAIHMRHPVLGTMIPMLLMLLHKLQRSNEFAVTHPAGSNQLYIQWAKCRRGIFFQFVCTKAYEMSQMSCPLTTLTKVQELFQRPFCDAEEGTHHYHLQYTLCQNP